MSLPTTIVSLSGDSIMNPGIDNRKMPTVPSAQPALPLFRDDFHCGRGFIS